MLAGFFLRQLGMHMLEERYERFKGERSSGFSLAQIFHVHDPEIYKRRSSITLKPTFIFSGIISQKSYAYQLYSYLFSALTVSFFTRWWFWIYTHKNSSMIQWGQIIISNLLPDLYGSLRNGWTPGVVHREVCLHEKFIITEVWHEVGGWQEPRWIHQVLGFEQHS